MNSFLSPTSESLFSVNSAGQEAFSFFRWRYTAILHTLLSAQFQTPDYEHQKYFTAVFPYKCQLLPFPSRWQPWSDCHLVSPAAHPPIQGEFMHGNTFLLWASDTCMPWSPLSLHTCAFEQRLQLVSTCGSSLYGFGLVTALIYVFLYVTNHQSRSAEKLFHPIG